MNDSVRPGQTPGFTVKLLALWCVVLVAMACFVPPAFADSATETAVVNNPNPADRLHLRRTPSQSGESLFKYYNGVIVEVLEHTSADWVKVRVGMKPGCVEGYMMAKYLAFNAEGAKVKSAIPKLKASAASWGILAAPVPVNNYVGLYGDGEYADLMGFSSGWWHLRVNGQTGFFMSSQQVLSLVDGAYTEGYDTAVVCNPNPEDRLNLRESPSMSSKSLGKYFNGVTVAVVREVNAVWVKVRIGTLDGYMMRAFLRFEADPGSVPSAMPTVTVNRTSGRRLNLREKPSDTSPSLGLFAGGTAVRVLGLTEDWYHVEADGQLGFMMAGYLTPRLAWNTAESDAAAPVSEPAAGSAWAGPVGAHPTAAWTIPILDYTGVVSNPNPQDRLHLRAAPDGNAASLGKYYNGVTVVINGDISGEWTPVGIGNLRGYMKTEYLSISASSPPASAMPVMTVRNPNPAANLNLREKQSTASRSLGLYPNGTQVVLMGFDSVWAHVIVDGEMGFMLGKYLQ